ncbi:hypothetical protein HAX54_040299, partial [Datura stramonium]|nr:hypothetical protein [Datura stramonium]
MPMERWSKLQLASGNCLESALHRRFADQNWRLTALLPVELLSSQFTASHRRANDSLWIPSGGSPVLPDSLMM